MAEIIQRYAQNPILTPDMIPGANAVFNSSVTRFGDRYAGVFRVETRQGYQTLRLAFSDDGIRFNFTPDEILVPTEAPFTTYEEARYDPRITRIDDIYYICHASENRFGCQVSVAKTRDFQTLLATGEENFAEGSPVLDWPILCFAPASRMEGDKRIFAPQLANGGAVGFARI